MKKPTVGQKILVVRGVETPVEVTVYKVGRKYFAASHRPEEWTHRQFRLSDWHATDYSGVQAYESVEAIAIAQEVKRMEKERADAVEFLRKFFGGWEGEHKRLTHEQIMRIKTLCSVSR